MPTERVAFGQRTREPGVELILKESIRINLSPKNGDGADLISIDTTFQEKNIPHPTDDKLYKKIITKC